MLNMRALPFSVMCLIATSQLPAVAAGAAAHATLTAINDCATSNRDAAVRDASVPEMPFIALLAGTTGTTLVKVDLASSGALSGATLFKSSGTNSLDRAALTATRFRSFRPEIRNCAPVAGSYLYAVEFAS